MWKRAILAMAGYAPATESGAGRFVPSPGLPDRFQDSQPNSAFAQALAAGAKLRARKAG